MTSHDPAEATPPRRDDTGRPQRLSRAVDWTVSLALALAGLAVGGGGIALLIFADPALVAGAAADLGAEFDLVSTTVLTDTLYNFVVWGGGSLVVLGLIFVGGGVGFLYYRTRLRGTEVTPNAVPDTKTSVVVGATVTALLSFVPFSSVLGGGAVGYLQRNRDTNAPKLGTISGIFASIPRAVVGTALVGGAMAAGALPIAGLVALSVVVGVSAILTLSGFGAYLGANLGP